MKIEGTEEQPTIILDKGNNQFMFTGKSLIEDPRTFYQPVLDWIDEYSIGELWEKNLIGGRA